jgi:hypothetical protein
MRPKSQTLLDKIRAQQLSQGTDPLLVVIENDPEAAKNGNMRSNREAMIGDDHHEALEDETTAAFHTRLKQIAKERGCSMVMLGHPSNPRPPEPPHPSGRPDNVTLN